MRKTVVAKTLLSSILRSGCRLPRQARRWAANTNGSALVMFGVIAPVVIGVTGLGVDAVSWYLTKRELQVIADSAAVTGAHVLHYKRDQSLAMTSGAQEASDALSTRLASTVINVVSPPSSGPYAGDGRAVSVNLTFTHPLYFSGVLMGTEAVIHASAVARPVANGEYCVLALDPSADRAVDFSGDADVELGCGVMSNSASSEALYVSGSTHLVADPNAAVGDIYVDGSADLIAETPPQPLSPRVEDPYGPEGRNLQVPNGLGPCLGHNMIVNGSVTLSPGRYCNGLHITAGNVTFLPGTYYIDGGTFKVTGGATLTGEGVTFVLTGSGGNFATLDIAGGSTLNLSAPLEGSGAPYEGLLFYQDQAAPMLQGSVPVKNKIVGGADMSLSGAIYIPNQMLEISGGADGNTDCLQIVARQVNFSAETLVNNSCAADSGQAQIAHYRVTLVQ